MHSALALSKRIGLVVAPLLVSSLAGCSALDMLAKPSAHITGVKFGDIGLKAATLVFDVDVSNPYSVVLPLMNIDYGLASGATPFLSGKADLQGTVPARGSKTVSLPVQIAYAGLLDVLKGVRPGAVVPYTAEMGLSVNAPVAGVLRLPLKKEGKLPVPTVPEVSVQEIKWDKVSLDRAGGRFKLNMVNRNQFPIELSKLTYGLSLGETEVANSSLTKAVPFGADGGAGTIDIPISFSPKQMGLAVFQMITGKKAGYTLKGMLDVKTPFGPMSLPINKVGDTLLRR